MCLPLKRHYFTCQSRKMVLDTLVLMRAREISKQSAMCSVQPVAGALCVCLGHFPLVTNWLCTGAPGWRRQRGYGS